ncbi:MAG: leucine-rich repeat protein [Oscillospiraceae bacterium]|nr:leucine-rich repeat protein [Oscillospiraceae bacterium]
MENLNSIKNRFSSEFDFIELIKKSKRSSIFMLRKKENGERFILRIFEGSADVYQKIMEISSPNLPKVFFAEEDEGTAVVLEEFVMGDTLYDILCGGILSEEDAEKIILQLCRSLEKLHELGIVHRDIKPENVIIRGDEAVLIDFDASRTVDPEKDTDTKILGTTGFAAPEQYGISQTDARADIYSLGVMLNVMLTGAHPSIKLAPGPMGDIVQKCTMINPDKRYQSADEIIKSIKTKKKSGKKHIIAAVFALIAVLLAAFAIFGSGSGELQEEKDPGLKLYGWETAQGESKYLPEGFYDYWSTDEFVGASQLSLSLPGDMEEYVSYRFEDDILNIIIHEIPDEEFRENKYNLGDELYADIKINAPSEDIEWVVFHQGNGPTYSNLKNQVASGEELYYSTYNPETDEVITNRPFAKIVSVGGKTKASFYETSGEFYAVMAWKNSEGEKSMQILPYRILTENDAKNYFGYDIWMDYFWEPVTDPERIIFREVYGDYNFYTEEEMEEAGFVLDVFENPGEITVKTGAVSKIDIGKIANAEAYLLPPDAVPKKESESYEEWLQRIETETKYIGYKLGHSTGVVNGYESAKNIENIVNKNPFFYVDDHHTCATNIMETAKSDIEGTTVWTTKDDTKDVVMTIDWYTEDFNKNPDAKPAKREYLYTAVEPFIYYDSDEIIAGGYCGSGEDYSSVVWNLDSKGELSISGRGDMADYTESEFVPEIHSWVYDTPWGEFAEECKTLSIGEGITSVGTKAFAGMKNLSGRLVIPESVTEIGYDAFVQCGFDCELVIPGSVETIGESAFSEWNKGEKGKLVIEEGLEHLGNNAFFGGNFTDISLPSTLRDIQASAFDRNLHLKKFSINKNNRDLFLIDDAIYTRDMKILVEVLGTKKGEFTVPEDVKIIGIGAFQWSNVEKVIIPEGVENICRGAFNAFEGEVHIIGRLQSINDFAFYPGENKNLSVYFHGMPPLSVYSSDSVNPSFCEYEADIDIFINRKYKNEWELDSKGLWKGYEAEFFENKNSSVYSEIKYSPEKRIDGGICGANLSWDMDSNGVLKISGTGSMYDYEDTIDSAGYASNSAPWGKYAGKVKQLYIEEGVETIGKNAFHRMNITGRLNLPSTLRKIEFWGFCGNLFSGNLVIPKGVTEIAQDAFQAAGNFGNISIPSTVINIGPSPFRYCLAQSITVDEDNPNYSSLNGALCSKGNTMIIQAPDGVTGIYTVPESITEIGKSAFEKVSASRINIMGDISFIDETAFQGYTGEIAFYGNVGDIKGSAFNNFVGNGMTVYFIDG